MPAATFMPLVHQMNLDTQLDRQIISYALKHLEQSQERLALNISLPFIKDALNIQWLQQLISNCSQPLSFELSNHDLLTSVDTAISFSRSIRESGHIFGIDRFTVDDSNLHYLQAINPSYIKIDSHYLHDMICDETGIQNNALKIMIQSLDIKIIATSIEDESIKDTLTKAGITHFQGSLLARAQIL